MIDKLPFTDDGYLKTNTNTNKWPNRENGFFFWQMQHWQNVLSCKWHAMFYSMKMKYNIII